MANLKFKVGDKVKTEYGIGKVLYIGDKSSRYLVGIHGFDGHNGNDDKRIENLVIVSGYKKECRWFDEDVLLPYVADDETVDHPSHYNQSKYECIDEMVALFGIDAVIGFCKCNIHKYRSRSQFKGGDEDLKKSDWYIDKLLELEGKKNDQSN